MRAYRAQRVGDGASGNTPTWCYSENPMRERIVRSVFGDGAMGEKTPIFCTTHRGRVTSSLVDSFSSKPHGRIISFAPTWSLNLFRKDT